LISPGVHTQAWVVPVLITPVVSTTPVVLTSVVLTLTAPVLLSPPLLLTPPLVTPSVAPLSPVVSPPLALLPVVGTVSPPLEEEADPREVEPALAVTVSRPVPSSVQATTSSAEAKIRG
jgi:type VI secretion system secreted protein VgrG